MAGHIPLAVMIASSPRGQSRQGLRASLLAWQPLRNARVLMWRSVAACMQVGKLMELLLAHGMDEVGVQEVLQQVEEETGWGGSEDGEEGEEGAEEEEEEGDSGEDLT